MNPILAPRRRRTEIEKWTLWHDVNFHYNGKLPRDVLMVVYEQAWELGHADGYNMVEYYYDILVEMVEKIFELKEDEK